jgi:2'-5' RNA ligase
VQQRASSSDASRIGEVVASAQVERLAEVSADHFALIRSILKPTGAEYTVLEEFPLREGRNTEHVIRNA